MQEAEELLKAWPAQGAFLQDSCQHKDDTRGPSLYRKRVNDC